MALMMLTAGAANAAENMYVWKALTVPAQTDVNFSVPFNKVSEDFDSNGTGDIFTVASKGTNGEVDVASLTAAAVDGTYYVRFMSGTAEGLWSTIDGSNPANGVDLVDDYVLANVSVGDTFRIYKHLTVGDLFPHDWLGNPYPNNTTLFFYNNDISSMDTNKSSDYSVVFYGSWFGGPPPTYNTNANTIMPPQSRVKFRNPGTSTVVTFFGGYVADFNIATLVSKDGDLYVGHGYPFSASLLTSTYGVADNASVGVYDNSATGYNNASNPAESATYYGAWYPGAWDANVDGMSIMRYRLPNDAGITAGTKVMIPKPY